MSFDSAKIPFSVVEGTQTRNWKLSQEANKWAGKFIQFTEQ